GRQASPVARVAPTWFVQVQQGRGDIGRVGHISLMKAARTELIGDSARGAEFALVRLVVEGERIVDADADGLDEPIVGLSLLEAAAVGGETLAVDALANALAPAFRAAPSSSRVAVAMSGGVDSAVALLRAGQDAIG